MGFERPMGTLSFTEYRARMAGPRSRRTGRTACRAERGAPAEASDRRKDGRRPVRVASLRHSQTSCRNQIYDPFPRRNIIRATATRGEYDFAERIKR
jgi:hypothetical protein